MDSGDSSRRDWPFDVALVPSTARSILISGGEPRHWCFAAQSLHREGTLVVIACVEADDAAFERALRQCSAGTLLLQDIDQASSTRQERLLRFLPGAHHGGEQPSTRVIAGSRRRLVDLVIAGVFDEELFYRLSTWHIVLDGQ